MKKFLPLSLMLFATSAFAQDIQFDNLSKSDVENVSREFAATFSHTGVSAPETDGLWGVEVGVIAGQSKSPDLKDVIDASGGKGSDFKNLYHAGVMARAHFPFDIFAELTILPERDFDDVTVSNKSFELGWNAGGFFNLPLDLAVAVNRTNSEISFKQEISNVDNKIDLETITTMYWIGVSKTFLFVTPYLKIGRAKTDADLKSTVSVLQGSTDTKISSDPSGGYLALGANLQFAFFKLGAEFSQIMDVKRTSAKISFDF